MIKKTLLAAGVTFLTGSSFLTAEEAPAQPALSAEQQEAMQKALQQFQAQQQKPALPDMTVEEATAYFSRGAGIGLATQLKNDKMVDKTVFLKAMNETLEGKFDETSIDQAKMQGAMAVLQKAQADKIKTEGTDFLAKNKTAEGVKVTASGLQYKVVAEGEGDVAVPTDQVKVHYTGKLIDGTVFDSSVERGEPAVFGVTQVIPGWTEGLQLMKPGAKYEFVIPSELAYGERGAGANIPPHSVLSFTVELLEIIKPAPVEEKKEEVAPAAPAAK